jgi:hypothetical protein
LGVGALVIVMVLATSYAALAKPLSNRQWHKQATAICKQFHEDRGAILPANAFSVTPDEAQAYVEQAVPLYEELITSIDALDEPKANTKKVKTFVKALTATIATIEDTPLAAYSGFEDPFAKANSAAKKLGLGSCTGLGDQRI